MTLTVAFRPMIRSVLRDRFRRVWVILAGMTALAVSVEAVTIMIDDDRQCLDTFSLPTPWPLHKQCK